MRSEFAIMESGRLMFSRRLGSAMSRSSFDRLILEVFVNRSSVRVSFVRRWMDGASTSIVSGF